MYDIICIGNYTKDTIISPAGTRHVDGGGMNYAASAASQLGYKTAVITRLAHQDQHVVQAIQSRGIDCYVTVTSTSTCLTLDYPTNNPDFRTLTITSTAGTITADEVAPLQTRSAIIGASLRGEVGLDVIHLLRDRGVFLAADMQGYVRVLREQQLQYESWPEMQAVLALLDVVKSDAVEAECLTGEKDIHRAARYIAELGPREIVLTHKDGLLIYADGTTHEFGFYPVRMEGRSGRGDTCVGSYMARRLDLPPREAGIWAAAVTSLKMETLGPFNRSLQEVEALIQAKYH